MLLLAFDTSTPAVTVALVDVEPGGMPPRPVGARTEIATNRHGELLAPLIRDVLVDAGAEVGDLRAIGVGLGPGPFTGLRVGIVTAKAMADALSIPAYGACSLDVVADRHRDEISFAIMTDARRKQVYWATYNQVGGREEGPEISRPEDLARSLVGRVTHVAGAGALLYRETFTNFVVVADAPYPAAVDLAHLVSGNLLAGRPSDDLTPLYLRRPDAQPPGPPKLVTPV